MLYWIIIACIIAGIYIMFIRDTSPVPVTPPKSEKEIDTRPQKQGMELIQCLLYGGDDRYPVDIDKGLRMLEKASTSGDMSACKKLAKLHHNGIPENSECAGLKPDMRKAIYWYDKYYKMSGDPEALISIGDMYHWGIGNTGIDLKKAKSLYFQIIHNNKIPDYHRGVVRDRLRQLNEEMGLSPEDGLPITSNLYNYTYTTLEDTITASISGSTPLPRAKKQIPDIIPVDSNGNNVHDHVVFNTVKQSVKNLQRQTDIYFKLPEVLAAVKSHIMECDLDQRVRDYALHVLEFMVEENKRGVAQPSTELDLLHLVWNRIHNNINRNHRNELKDNLIKQLAECIEHGQVVCPKGRYDHILDTLTGVDPGVNIIPKWVVIQEMLSKARAIRDKFMMGLHPLDRKVLEANSPEPEERIKYEHLSNQLKAKIFEDFTRTYVEPGLLSEDLLNTEVGNWINDIL